MNESRTRTALERVANGESVSVVARDIGISTSAIYAAMKRREGKTVCPCCNQVVMPGFSVNKGLLK